MDGVSKSKGQRRKKSPADTFNSLTDRTLSPFPLLFFPFSMVNSVASARLAPQAMQEVMTMSAPPCPFDGNEQSLTAHHFSFRSTPVLHSSSSATTSPSLLSEEEVVSDHDPGFPVLVNTNLDTSIMFTVRGGQTIFEVKEEVMCFHSSYYPRFGEIKIIDIKLYVDVSSSVEHHGEQLRHNWFDTYEDSQLDNGVIGQEQSGDLQTCSICLRGLGASSLGPREIDDKEMSLEGLTKNPLIVTEPVVVADARKISGTQHSVSEHGDKKRKKPTPKKISIRKKDTKGKRHMPKRAGNSVLTVESLTKPNEENFHTGTAGEGTLQSYSSNKIASSSRKALRSDENPTTIQRDSSCYLATGARGRCTVG